MEGWSPEGRMGDQLGGPEYALLVPIHRATNPSGEVGLSSRCNAGKVGGAVREVGGGMRPRPAHPPDTIDSPETG
jgi:hypothetical protein